MPSDSRDDIYKEAGMPLLHPGDTFSQLTLNIPGAQAIQVPGWFAGEFGLLLFNRGAWCPYCTAQLRAFQRAGNSLTQAGIRVAALTGAFVNEDPLYLQSTGFVLDPQGKVIVSVYSSGAIGRLVPDDVIGLVRYLHEHAAASS